MKDPVTRISSFALSCVQADQPTLKEIVDLDLHFNFVVQVNNRDRGSGCSALGTREQICSVSGFRPLSQLFRRNMC